MTIDVSHCCGNCPFADRDPDDGQLYCHESSPLAHPIFVQQGSERKPVIVGAQQQEPAQQIKVLGIVGFFPEVNPSWSCWKHPYRQPERRRLEGAGEELAKGN